MRYFRIVTWENLSELARKAGLNQHELELDYANSLKNHSGYLTVAYDDEDPSKTRVATYG